MGHTIMVRVIKRMLFAAAGYVAVVLPSTDITS